MKFRCARTASLAREIQREDIIYGYGKRLAFRYKAELCFFLRKWCAYSTREISALSTEITQACTRTRSPSCRSNTAAPNCPTRFHLTHVALEYWAGGSLGKQREVLTYIREAICFPHSRYLCRPASTASSLKRPGIPCHEIAVQNATSVEIAKNFYY